MDTSIAATYATPRKKMPAEVFYQIWLSPSFNLNGTEWLEFVKFDDVNGERRINFSNVQIEDEVSLGRNAIPANHLILSNCYLPKCELFNAKARTILIQQDSTVGGFKIVDSTIGDVTIENSQTGDFEIITSHAGRFRINNSIVADVLIVAGSVSEGFEIRDTITGNFLIKKNSVTRGFWFEGSTIGLFKFENSKGTILSFRYECKVSKIYVWNGSLQRIQIRNNSFVGHLRLQINFQEPAHVIFENSQLGFLDYENIVIPEFGTFNIIDSSINLLYFNNFCNYGTIFFSGLRPLDKWIDFVKNEEGIPILAEEKYQFESRTEPSILRLTNSDLGKTQFIDCDLRQFNRFEFSNTKMLDVFVAGSQMPEDKSFCLPDDEKTALKIAEQKRLAYGQFKKIYEIRGDIAGSLPYLSYEMEAYRQQLQIEGWWKNRGELAMLWANKLSTNYGVSWQRGLGAALLSVAFFYSIFCYLIGYRFENNSPDDVERFWKLVSYAPYYLNPLRDLDSVSLVKEEDFTPWARIWDFISRIFVAYFVYQTIQAFRKLGKSSG